MYLKKWEKVSKSVEYSLKRTVDLFPFRASIRVDHFHDSSFSEGSDKNIENKEESEAY